MTKLPLTDEFTDPVEVRRSAFLFLACVLILLAIGTVMVYSASAAVAAEAAHERGVAGSALNLEHHGLTPLRSHGMKVLLGVTLLALAARMDYRRWLQWSRPFYLGALVLLVLVLVPGIGAKINGARRWFQLDLVPFALQPSELAKLALIVFLSAFIARTPQLDRSFRHGLLPGAIAVLVPAVLILVETDVGTCLLVSMLGFSLLVLAGARILHLAYLGAAALPLLAYFVVQKLPYVMHRFQGFSDPPPTSQVGFGLSAMSVGGLTGIGLGGGRYKLFYLAEGENDFILSVIGEELGFIGTTIILALFAVLLWSGARVLLGVRNRFGFFLVAGVLLTIATQALINLAVATGSVPVKGMPLPFVSAGGSSLAVLCLAVGLVMSVARHPDLPSVSMAAATPPEGKGSA